MTKIPSYAYWLIALITVGLFSQHSNKNVVPKYVPVPHIYPHEEVKEYPFVQYDSNIIQFLGKREGFDAFFDQLDTLVTYGKGNVNILHIGGSHVQAGMLSNRMRENMFTLADGIKGQRGFIFPFRMAHTNNPNNYKATFTGTWEGCRNAKKNNHCPWGLSGITATTYDTATTCKLYAVDNTHTTYKFDQVKIYFLADKESYHLKLDSTMQVDHITTDSIAGVRTFHLADTYDTLRFETIKTDTVQSFFVLQGIKLENSQVQGLTYTSIGVNGASVPSYLRCQYFEPQLATNVPDLVIFGIGINDSYVPKSHFKQEEYEENYRQLMTMFRNVNPNVQFLFMTNNDSYYKRKYPNQNIFAVQKAMQNLAKEYNGAYWDLFEIMGGLNSIKLWQNAGLAQKDKVHFTRKGYFLNADLLFVAFRQAYGDHIYQKYSSK